MRVVKKPEERKNEILDAVDELFSQKGFDGTTTSDILEKVGIARGTLYYYFKSKEDLMDALVERYSDQLLGAANQIAADKQIPIIERIVRVVLSLNLSGGSSEEIMDHIHKPQNALMHQKIQKMIINEVTPIMAEIIQEGVEQGVFHTPYPYECVEMLLTYTNTVFDGDMVEMTDEERVRRMEAFIFHAERMLGAESGSLMEIIQIFGHEK